MFLKVILACSACSFVAPIVWSDPQEINFMLRSYWAATFSIISGVLSVDASTITISSANSFSEIKLGSIHSSSFFVVILTLIPFFREGLGITLIYGR